MLISLPTTGLSFLVSQVRPAVRKRWVPLPSVISSTNPTDDCFNHLQGILFISQEVGVFHKEIKNHY